MTNRLPSFVLGYHGTDRAIADAVFGGAEINPSEADHEWLGAGIYFWENSPVRALEWAYERMKRKKSNIKNPAVIGAIIDLGNCLNMIDQEAINLVRDVYASFYDKAVGMPKNVNHPSQPDSDDLIMRRLDCAVINEIHELAKSDKTGKVIPYDSVRALFIEGKPLYKDSGFRDRTHIQLCIRDPKQIIGYFRPRPDLSVIAQSATPN